MKEKIRNGLNGELAQTYWKNDFMCVVWLTFCECSANWFGVIQDRCVIPFQSIPFLVLITWRLVNFATSHYSRKNLVNQVC